MWLCIRDLLLHCNPDVQRKGLELLAAAQSPHLWRALMSGAQVTTTVETHLGLRVTPGWIQAVLRCPIVAAPRALTLHGPYPLDFYELSALKQVEALRIKLYLGTYPTILLDGLHTLPRLQSLEIDGHGIEFTRCPTIFHQLETLQLGALRSLRLRVHAEEGRWPLPTLSVASLIRMPTLRRVVLENVKLQYTGMTAPPPFALTLRASTNHMLAAMLPSEAERAQGMNSLASVTIAQGGEPIDGRLLRGLRVRRTTAERSDDP
jgi:hypothetical protein